MGEKVLKIKTVSEVAEAISGLKDLEGSLKGVGTAAFEAAGKSKGQWKELEAEWVKSSAAAKGVSTQVLAVESALNAMGRASSASQLEAWLVKSKVALDALEGKLRAVAAAGGTIDDGVTSSLDVMRASIDAGKAKLDEMKRSTEQARKELGLLAVESGKAGKAVAGAGDSTKRLGDSMRKETEGLNKFRGAAMEVWAALGIGKQVGEALSAVIDKQSASMAVHDQKMADAAVNSIKFQQAMKLVERGLLDVGGTQEQFLARYDAYIAKTSPAARATEAQTKALKEQAAAWKDLGTQMEASGKAVEFKFNAPSVEDLLPIDEATKYAERLNDILAQAFKVGGEDERQEWAEANKAKIEEVVAAYERFGAVVPEHVRAAYERILADQGAQRVAEETQRWIAEEAAAYEQLGEQVKRSREAESAAMNRTSRAPEQYKAIQDAAFGAAVANGELGTNLDRVAEAVVKTGGTMTVGAPIWISYVQASDEVTAALLRQAEAYGTLTAAQSEAMGAARGWTDYILTLKDGYESGLTSLYNYITGLAAFKTQLLQLFGSATGAAKETLDATIALIDGLMSNVGDRETFSSGPLGDLERSVKRQKEGR